MQTFEERIISYLKCQEILGEDNLNQSFTLIDAIAPEEEVGIILAEIVDKVIKRVVCRDRYENIRLWHNQFPLFDLSHIIPDFCIGKNFFIVIGHMQQPTQRNSFNLWSYNSDSIYTPVILIRIGMTSEFFGIQIIYTNNIKSNSIGLGKPFYNETCYVFHIYS